MKHTTLFSELNRSAPESAKRLLGGELERTLPSGKVLRARIVEVEAYDESDPASHSYKGRTMRNAAMYGPAGIMYTYFIYGMHYCCNITTGPEGHGEAVLIRAVEPLEGEEEMSRLRGGKTGHEITNGPSKLCNAMAIDATFNNHGLSTSPLRLILRDPLPLTRIKQTSRIGITKGAHTPWRFFIKENPYVSKQ